MEKLKLKKFIFNLYFRIYYFKKVILLILQVFGLCSIDLKIEKCNTHVYCGRYSIGKSPFNTAQEKLTEQKVF